MSSPCSGNFSVLELADSAQHVPHGTQQLLRLLYYKQEDRRGFYVDLPALYVVNDSLAVTGDGRLQGHRIRPQRVGRGSIAVGEEILRTPVYLEYLVAVTQKRRDIFPVDRHETV